MRVSMADATITSARTARPSRVPIDGESMCTSCPMHNDRETRVRVKARREREREWKAFLSRAARWEPRPRSADGCCLQCGHADTVNPTARPPPLCSPLVACGGCQSPPRPSCYYISFFCLRGTLYVMYDMCHTFCFLIYRKVQSRDRDSCLRTHVRKRE